MQIFKENANRENIVLVSEIPERIEFEHGKKPKAIFKDGKADHLACLKCMSPSCMLYDLAEITIKRVEDFPYNKSVSVCPVDAISWNSEEDVPSIDQGKCIACGVCAKRCAAGAVYWDSEMKINTTLSNYQQLLPVDENVELQHKEQLKKLVKVERTGTICEESDELAEVIISKLSKVGNESHNTIARNLFIASGCKSTMRRTGDVYTRMDLIYESGEDYFGAVEVEFGRDTLDASRAILDDIAVLHARYGINKNENEAFVVCLQLPNARQGYWQVVKDVSNVESIRINTITIYAMMLLIWNNKELIDERGLYYLDYDNMDLRNIIEKRIGRTIRLTKKHLGLLEPAK